MPQKKHHLPQLLIAMVMKGRQCTIILLALSSLQHFTIIGNNAVLEMPREQQQQDSPVHQGIQGGTITGDRIHRRRRLTAIQMMMYYRSFPLLFSLQFENDIIVFMRLRFKIKWV
mmetsp:Transcript_7967/g.13972  ORF Transcript_7967/g.13972 Transcript_7967/m.13972 type:complete len:115 (+) Transcript_7967:1500-1844(+)